MISELKQFKASDYLIGIEDCINYLIEIAKYNDKETFLSALEDVQVNLKASMV